MLQVVQAVQVVRGCGPRELAGGASMLVYSSDHWDGTEELTDEKAKRLGIEQVVD